MRKIIWQPKKLRSARDAHDGWNPFAILRLQKQVLKYGNSVAAAFLREDVVL